MGSNTKEAITTVKDQAERQADTARKELGEVAVDVTDRYFPEAASHRRRRHVAAGAAIGGAIGFLVGYLLGRR